MASKQGTTLEGFPLNVTKAQQRRDALDESQDNNEPHNSYMKKRSLSNVQTTESQIEKRKREAEFDDEETMLRDRFLDELDSLESPQISNKEIPMEEESSNEEMTFFQDRKIIKLKGKLPNLALPEGWLALNHRSGGIIYLHRSSRVCTWSRPYYIGKGSVRKHDVPIAAIPCLHQKKALESESKPQCFQNDSSNEQQLGDYNSGSVLNFLNTAGAPLLNEEMQQNNSAINGKGVMGYEVVGSHIEGQIDDSNKGGVSNVDSGDNDCNHHVEADHDIGEKYDCGVEGGDGKGSAGDECGCAVNSGNDNEAQSVAGCGHGVNKGDDRSAVDNYNQCTGFDTFHPMDGLDVINDTLPSIQSLQKTQNSTIKHDDPSQNVVSFSSSKSETASKEANKCLPISKEFCGIDNLPSRPNDAIDIKVKNDAGNEKVTNEISDGDEIAVNQSENVNSRKSKKSTTLSAQNPHHKPKPILNNTSTVSKLGIELVDSGELSVYLEKLFDFEELTQEQEQNVAITSVDQSSEQGEYTLPPLLECLPYCVKGINARQNKEWVLNPGGKTPIAILHEYSQAVLKEKPVYVCSECDSPATPFMAEVQINGITHGTGVASNKKQAKQVAAEATLQVFLPDVFKKIRDYEISPEELEYFDNLKIDHPNVYEVSIKSGLPSPSQVLQECLKRNQGVCSSIINFKIIPGENQNHSYKISCGKHTAEGFCKNKKTGKQLASQALLKKLHPHISTWGSLLRIYCDRPSSVVKKYKTKDEDDLMTRQHSLPQDAPKGELLLARLKEEMKKIADNTKQGGTREPRMREYTKDMTNPISTVDV